MKTTIKRISIICFIVLVASLLKASNPHDNQKPAQELSFKENLGQISDQNYHARKDILFSGAIGNLVFHLKNDGVSYQLNKVDTWKETMDAKTGLKRTEPNQSLISRVDIKWLNVNTQAKIKKESPLEGYENYYLSNCPSGALNVKSYGQIIYQQIYDGIDLKWYSKNGQLKYDYMVAAGVDYRQIQFEIKGADKIDILSEGDLQISTPLGIVTEQAPVVFQLGRTLKSRWIIKESIISFEIENLDDTKPFVIDPCVRVWGTFFGSRTTGNDCVLNKLGDIYMAGSFASDYALIATTGAYQTTFAGNEDAYLVKFNSNGARLWCTYYGGSGYEFAASCALDSSDNIYIAGTTTSYSNSIMATPGAHQMNLSNPGIFSHDLFLAKFNSNGMRIWSTYYGGANEEEGKCNVDKFGNVFLCGWTSSTDGTSIATNGSHQSTHAGGNGGNFRNSDGFLVKFNSNGVRQWGTYYGGSSEEEIGSCVFDTLGNIFISGYTSSSGSNAIATAGSYQSTIASLDGSIDAFLAKFNPLGIRVWGTYYGGEKDDQCTSSSIDPDGNIYMTGGTSSTTGIATSGTYNSILGNTFLTKFSSSGNRIWGTYYGFGLSTLFCTTDKMGDVFIGGNQSNFNGNDTLATFGSHQTTYGGGYLDAYLAKFSSAGSRIWCTYYGGIDIESIHKAQVNETGKIYVCGYSQSSNDTAITTVGSFQSSYLIYPNETLLSAFLVKFNDTETRIVSIDETPLNSDLVLVYPNPTNDFINIKIENTGSEFKSLSAEVISSTGQLCKHIYINDINVQTQIHVSDLAEGMYVLKIQANKSQILQTKFILKK